jgi:hypothetical protein
MRRQLLVLGWSCLTMVYIRAAPFGSGDLVRHEGEERKQ